MRELKYYVACTVDGFIAREDGSHHDFSFEGEHVQDLLARFPETIPGHLRHTLQVTADNQQFDAVLMGRRTYEVGLELGVTSPYPHLRQFVFSRSLDVSPDPQVSLISEHAVARVRELKQEPGKDIWLCGGGQLAGQLLGEIDELILKVNPFLLGAGIPLFGRVAQTKLDLRLVSQHVYEQGFVLQRFRVRR